MPGDYQTVPLTYTATTTDPKGEDVWLVFPTTGGASGANPSEAFTGAPDDSLGGGLGRYGHLAVSAPAGSFNSYNLNTERTTSGHTGSTCTTDADGHGGSDWQPTSPSDTTGPFCSPIKPILLSSGLKNGTGGTAQVTFGFTPLLRDQSQYASLNKIVSYELVATQHGVLPNNPFNPNPTQH